MGLTLTQWFPHIALASTKATKIVKTVIAASISNTGNDIYIFLLSYPDAQILLIKLFCAGFSGSKIKSNIFWVCLERTSVVCSIF